eukprot:TRINITY_DN6003_c0_g1_i5.p1 TRINITY_DN6003_c0_g1~~TRINITY_DN6003_c0_g1_i5.p1  ORF type:complete len:987 (-),score=132.38 TRINITY_DN6003_c0_g1_i5:180-3140(-)
MALQYGGYCCSTMCKGLAFLALAVAATSVNKTWGRPEDQAPEDKKRCCEDPNNDPCRTGNPVQGGTLNPLCIPQFKTPLVIPPIMKNNGRKNRYDIAVRQFQQQILPGGIWDTPLFNKKNCSYGFPATTVFGYGPASDERPDSSEEGGAFGIAPAPNSQFNYPAYTMENIVDKTTTVNWINELIKNPWGDEVGEYDEDKEEEYDEDEGDEEEHWSLEEEGVAEGQEDEREKGKHSGKRWRPKSRRWLSESRGCEYLPHLLAIDRTLHWANPERLPCHMDKGQGVDATDCRPDPEMMENPSKLLEPYTGPVPVVTHVHGAHTQPESDGYPEAWYLPDACNIPDHFARHGRLVNEFGQNRRTNQKQGEALFKYKNDQHSTTLWYHDHTLGMTRNNVYAGPVGFWLIREKGGGETGLPESTVLPHPPPQRHHTLADLNFPEIDGKPNKIREAIREIPIAIQDKSFNVDGSLFYPENRNFFEKGDGVKLASNIPFIGSGKDSDISPIHNPEFFGNVIVVNGVSWPIFEVKPEKYRFRILNGCNSRFLNLWLGLGDRDTGSLETPIYQIGSDQGLLSNVIKILRGNKTVIGESRSCRIGENRSCGNTSGLVGRCIPNAEALLLAPAERADVIIDFSKFGKNGIPVRDGQIFTLRNTAPDAPFTGFNRSSEAPDVPADAADKNTTGKIMEFRIKFDSSKPVDEIVLPKQEPCLGDPKKTRYLALIEDDKSQNETVCIKRKTPVDIPCGVDASSQDAKCPAEYATCPNFSEKWVYRKCENGGEPFDGPVGAFLGTWNKSSNTPTKEKWSDPISKFVGLGDVEDWLLHNPTGDAHPIHIHLVKFEVVERWKIDGASVQEGAGVAQNELGYKDTVIVYPGEVTQVRAKFDIPGLYVWHCHIVEHEDNEMMLPFCVKNKRGEPGPGCEEADGPDDTNDYVALKSGVLHDSKVQVTRIGKRIASNSKTAEVSNSKIKTDKKGGEENSKVDVAVQHTQ